MINRVGGHMNKRLFKYHIQTNKSQEFIDINHLIVQAIEESGVVNGIAVVYCPHTTAGITINENADSDVIRDMIVTLDRVFPIKGDYKHYEGNSHAHLKSSYVGADKTVIIYERKPILGIWQSVYFCDFDGPRKREVYVKIIND